MKVKRFLLIITLICAPLAAFGIITNKADDLVIALKGGANQSQLNNGFENQHTLNQNMSQPQNTVSKSDYEQHLQTIHTLREAKNIDGLTQVADEVEAKWGAISPHNYASLMLEIVNSLSGYNLNDARQYTLAIRYAKQALQRADALPLNSEIKLVRFLEGGPEYDTGQMKPEEWMQDRRERAKYWLHAWQRLNNEINRNFDFNNNRPRLNLLPPPGFGPAGIAPEAIKDPQARAKYEADIAANDAKRLEFNMQWELHNLDKYFTSSAKRFLAEAYSRPPYNTDELRQYLDSYHVDENTKRELLNQVATNIAPKS